MKDEKLVKALNVIKKAMDKGKDVEGSYARIWHKNMSIMCSECIMKELPDIDRKIADKIGDDTAVKIMNLCFSYDIKLEDE